MRWGEEFEWVRGRVVGKDVLRGRWSCCECVD